MKKHERSEGMGLNVAVFTLGLSPPIVTEFLLEMKKRGTEIDRVLTAVTEGSLPSFHILLIAFHWSRKVEELPLGVTENLWIEDLSSVKLEEERISVEDINEPEDCRTFRKQFSRALKKSLKWAKGNLDRVYVCVAGGRKTMPMDATMVSLAEGFRNVYHVVAPRIPGIAEDFARNVTTEKGRKLREDLEKFASRPSEAPLDLVEHSLKVSFPPRDLDFHLIKIPIPRLGEEERKRFKEELFK